MTQSLIVVLRESVLSAITGGLLAVILVQIVIAIARLARSVRRLFQRPHRPTMPRTVDRTSEAD
jgi:hypothetical protein